MAPNTAREWLIHNQDDDRALRELNSSTSEVGETRSRNGVSLSHKRISQYAVIPCHDPADSVSLYFFELQLSKNRYNPRVGSND